MIVAYVVIGIVAVLLIVFVVIYNRLVRMRNGMKNAWAQLDVQLKRRHDLIPNLVETVKGYAQHERQTFESVTNARNKAISLSGAGSSVASRAKAETVMGAALGRLLVVAENYPDLKANQNFLSLQQELSNTENQISTARQDYNNMVQGCNNLYQMFPSNIVARMFGYRPEEFFKVESPEERMTPEIGFHR